MTEEIVRRLRGAPGDRERLRRRRTRARRARRRSAAPRSTSITRRKENARSPSTTSSSRSAARLDEMPDLRYWFVDENGLRAITLDVTGTDSDNGRERRRRARGADAAHPADRRRHLGNRARAAGAAHPPAHRHAGAPRRLHRRALGDDPGGDDGRHRPGARPVRHRRPAGADPRPARREGAHQPTDHRAAARADGARPGGVPLGAIADISLDQGPTNDRSLRPQSPRRRGRRSRRQVLARRRDEGDLRPAGDEEPSQGHQRSANRATRRTWPNSPTASPTP